MTGTIEERLAAAKRRVDELEALGHRRGAASRQRIRRRVEVLRQEQAVALQAARRAPDETDELVARLVLRLEVAERSLEADLAETGSGYLAAVEAELDSWDRYAERHQATAARAGANRDRAEAALAMLRGRRLALTERLQSLSSALETWHRHQTRVTAARVDLERLADDLSTSVF